VGSKSLAPRQLAEKRTKDARGIFNFRSGIFQYEREFLGERLMTCALSARPDM